MSKGEPRHWDRMLKMLTQTQPQEFVSWILQGAVYQGDLNLELQKKAPIFADLLYTITYEGKEAVFHVEFQGKQDDRMGRRVWEYNCLACIHTELPVYSVVIYLLNKEKDENEEGNREKEHPIVEPPYEIEFPTGLRIHQFQFQNIKLWEISTESLKEQSLPILLPLLPLTEGGKSCEVVEEVIQGLEQADRADLLPLAYVFAAYTFEQENELQWLKERFEKMQDMLEDNCAYRQMVQWAEEKALKRGLEQGREQGREQGLERGLEQGLEQGLQAQRATVVSFVEKFFPDQLALAKQQVRFAMTLVQVQELLEKLFAARTGDEVKEILLSIPHV